MLFSENEIRNILNEKYQLTGEIKALPGYDDINFKISTKTGTFLLKISAKGTNQKEIEFQQALLNHLNSLDFNLEVPAVVQTRNGNDFSYVKCAAKASYIVRMQTWIEGRLWNHVNPISPQLLESLGEKSGVLTQVLFDLKIPNADRFLDWDLANIQWTKDHLSLFEGKRKKMLAFFHAEYENIRAIHQGLRKSIIHSDVNDFNIIVNHDLANPKVKGIIDFGDAVLTQTINDLAITLAYAIMDQPDPLFACDLLIKAYHQQFAFNENELQCLYALIAMRLVTTVTQAAINRKVQPNKAYLFVSEKPAWAALEKWYEINKDLAYYNFRSSCGMTIHPMQNKFEDWAKEQNVCVGDLFEKENTKALCPLDLSVSSTWLGHESAYSNDHFFEYKLKEKQAENPDRILAGGYLEPRILYTTDAYLKDGFHRKERRSIHLGLDFWLDAGTPVRSLFDGEVFSVFDNEGDKDYGPTIILKHTIDAKLTFYSLYGHLSKSSLILSVGTLVKKGTVIGTLGNKNENGNWIPHLHFQLMLDLLGNTHDFPGVAFPSERKVWAGICPDPNLLFKEKGLFPDLKLDKEAMLDFRNKHLGKGMSLSYNDPLHIVRGTGVYLIDALGRSYLDTVNNVAHVGHEHPDVVKAGQEQMAVLNTNSRYLHQNILDFAKALLATFPPELSVVHFVNSGSEANELAMRMAKTVTKQKDMIALEIGYHGNTNACIEVSSYKFEGKGGEGKPKHTHIVPLPDTFRGKYQGENTGVKYAKHVEDIIQSLAKEGKAPAGFIVESIVSCGGQIELPKDFLKQSFEAVKNAGGLCIADEVQTGVGRVGHHFWAFEMHEVIPDIVTIGKPIGNGHPLAAVVCTEKVANDFANGMEFFNTFGGNPVSCAIGTAVLNVVKDEALQANALSIGTYLKEALSQLKKDFPIIGQVRGQGLFLGFELVDEAKQPLAKETAYLAKRMKEKGVLMSVDGMDHNVIKIKPPIVFNQSNAEELISKLTLVFKEDFLSK